MKKFMKMLLFALVVIPCSFVFVACGGGTPITWDDITPENFMAKVNESTMLEFEDSNHVAFITMYITEDMDYLGYTNMEAKFVYDEYGLTEYYIENEMSFDDLDFNYMVYGEYDEFYEVYKEYEVDMTYPSDPINTIYDLSSYYDGIVSESRLAGIFDEIYDGVFLMYPEEDDFEGVEISTRTSGNKTIVRMQDTDVEVLFTIENNEIIEITFSMDDYERYGLSIDFEISVEKYNYDTIYYLPDEFDGYDDDYWETF